MIVNQSLHEVALLVGYFKRLRQRLSRYRQLNLTERVRTCVVIRGCCSVEFR